jgi:hypothetical protein
MHLCARSGLTIFWRHQFEVPGDDCMYPLIVHAGDVKKITVTHMIGSLQVLGVGMIVSLLILMVEIVYWLGWLLPRRRRELSQQLASMYGQAGGAQAPHSLNDIRMSPGEQQLLLANTMASTGFLGWLRRCLTVRGQVRMSSTSDRQRFLADHQRAGTSFGMPGNPQWNSTFAYAPNSYSKSNLGPQLTYRSKMHSSQYATQYSNMYSNPGHDYNAFVHQSGFNAK